MLLILKVKLGCSNSSILFQIIPNSNRQRNVQPSHHRPALSPRSPGQLPYHTAVLTPITVDQSELLPFFFLVPKSSLLLVGEHVTREFYQIVTFTPMFSGWSGSHYSRFTVVDLIHPFCTVYLHVVCIIDASPPQQLHYGP